MGRKENEKVGFFNCHGMGGNQVRGKMAHLNMIFIVCSLDSDFKTIYTQCPFNTNWKQTIFWNLEIKPLNQQSLWLLYLGYTSFGIFAFARKLQLNRVGHKVCVNCQLLSLSTDFQCNSSWGFCQVFFPVRKSIVDLAPCWSSLWSLWHFLKVRAKNLIVFWSNLCFPCPCNSHYGVSGIAALHETESQCNRKRGRKH